MTDNYDHDSFDERKLIASIVAISLPCFFIYSWIAVLVVSSLFILAALRWPALVLPMFLALGAVTVVSQFVDAVHGDAFSRWWMIILIPWLVFLSLLALFDEKQRVLGVMNHYLSKCDHAYYLWGAILRISCAITLPIATLWILFTCKTSLMVSAFLISTAPMYIIVLSEGFRMLQIYRSRSPTA